MDSGSAQGGAAGHVVVPVPLGEEFQGIALVEYVLRILDDDLTTIVHSRKREAR